ncbi:MAG: 2-oxoacid:acceptor oxidoreductase subunit alpha [Candidatus Lokiarchaeota archaeon]|nr:2-oxoacid:acceptor oxidoreductase subunit alpha [Candidatus Lokiarchaeota archaeon]
MFSTGNEAILYGALLGQCKFFAGYPITPATEILEGMAQYMPLLDGNFLQMEDEIASLAAIIGASWNGIRTMTATSGPGFSLMQELIGYACMTETPCVIVDVQRSGPSTGQPTMPAQGDILQARWGTHGDHSIIALYPNSIQECLELTTHAFNLSDKYRSPVILLSDAALAHQRERLIIPDLDKITIIKRVPVTIDKKFYQPFRTGFTRPSKIPEMDRFGDMYHTYLTGLTHDWKANPETTDPLIHEELIKRFYEKISDNRKDIIKIETEFLDDAEICVLSYGITSRAVKDAVKNARNDGYKVGSCRLITIWPFADEKILEIAQSVKKIIVPELNMGQIYHNVSEYSQGLCEVIRFPKIGGTLISPKEIYQAIRRHAR